MAMAMIEMPRSDAEALANHWLGAGQTARALTVLVAGAAQAQQALAFERALSLYERALVLCDDPMARETIEARARAVRSRSTL
jgi:hypothetical protein